MLMNGIAVLLIVRSWGSMEYWYKVQHWYLVLLQGRLLNYSAKDKCFAAILTFA